MEEESDEINRYGVSLVDDGKVSQARIDEAVRRVLRLKFQLGLFDHPYSDDERDRKELLSPEHVAAAREIAGRSIVLLRNDRSTLPLRKDLRSIAVLGPLADDRAAARGTGEATARMTTL